MINCVRAFGLDFLYTSSTSILLQIDFQEFQPLACQVLISAVKNQRANAVSQADVSSVSCAVCPSLAESHQEGPLAKASELLPLLQHLPPRQALPAGLHQPKRQAAASVLQRVHQPDVQRFHRPQLLTCGRRTTAATQEPGQRSDLPALSAI